jgi:hypothetical protein
MKRYLYGISLLACLLLMACKKNEDLLTFKTNDKELEIGVYKSTILLVTDEEQVKRVGVRGFKKMDGDTDISLFGFTCGENGGSYSELSVDRKDKDGFVGFDSDNWSVNGDRLIDQLAQEVCKIGLNSNISK